tara:strand:- start:670 stop:855 length:186 start_codon:yes stop_codon:yes gene_type:complete
MKEYSIWNCPRSEWDTEILRSIKLPCILNDQQIEEINRVIRKNVNKSLKQRIQELPNYVFD